MRIGSVNLSAWSLRCALLCLGRGLPSKGWECTCAYRPAGREPPAHPERSVHRSPTLRVLCCRRYGGESYYTCDRLTLCPIQKKMMVKEVGSFSPCL